MNAVRSDSVDFFLGTTTPAGFKGYFEPLRREPGMHVRNWFQCPIFIEGCDN